MIALLAGMVIFPIVFQFGLKPTDGPGLIFLTLPLAFNEITGGYLFSGLFFILLGFAAITSALSLLEPSVAWMIENKNYSRNKSAFIIGILIWLLGFLSIFHSMCFQNLHSGKEHFLTILITSQVTLCSL